MLKKLVLLLSLAISSLSFAYLTESEIKAIDNGLELIKSVGGLYIVSVEAPVKDKEAIFAIMTEASKNESCDEFFASPEPHTLVYKGPEGAKEAKRMKVLLEEKGCVVELIEII